MYGNPHINHFFTVKPSSLSCSSLTFSRRNADSMGQTMGSAWWFDHTPKIFGSIGDPHPKRLMEKQAWNHQRALMVTGGYWWDILQAKREAMLSGWWSLPASKNWGLMISTSRNLPDIDSHWGPPIYQSYWRCLKRKICTSTSYIQC